MSLRDTILAAQDIPQETVTVDEWGVTLLLIGMTAGERLAVTQAAYDQTTGSVNMALVYPDLLIACCHDPESRDKVFTPDDRSAILGKASSAVEMLAGKAMRLSGIGKDVQDEVGKDSSDSPSDDSPLNSPSV